MSDLFYRYIKYRRILSGTLFEAVFHESLCLLTCCMLVLINPHWEKKLVDVNLQQRKFVGIQFVIWSGGTWIKNNGANFFVALQPMLPSGKVILLSCTE